MEAVHESAFRLSQLRARARPAEGPLQSSERRIAKEENGAPCQKCHDYSCAILKQKYRDSSEGWIDAADTRAHFIPLQCPRQNELNEKHLAVR